MIAAEARRFKFLLESDKLDADDKEMYRELIALNKEQNPALSVKLRFSLKNLPELLYKQYGQKTIVLIDEYDVPVFKESIFTGLNNFKILSITDIRFDEQFGFTEQEVKNLLHTYHLESHLPEIKEWYDGYHFGDAAIIVEPEDPDAGIILELKYSREASGLDKACERAIEQIKDRRYWEYLKNDGRHNMMFYGIAFYKKRCKAVVERFSVGTE